MARGALWIAVGGIPAMNNRSEAVAEALAGLS
jgi:hypothetical protein